MKQENLTKLLFELIKNSKRSDRDLARILDISQPTVTRLRGILEKEAIKQYTAIPNLSYIGLDIIAFIFSSTKELVHPLWDKAREWAKDQPNVVFVSTGQGIDSDALIISIHADYSDFVKFYQAFRRDWGKFLRDFKVFLISMSGSINLKPFSYNYLIGACQKSSSE
jgi:DNA-binding Lrp family transcriptional regulator